MKKLVYLLIAFLGAGVVFIPQLLWVIGIPLNILSLLSPFLFLFPVPRVNLSPTSLKSISVILFLLIIPVELAILFINFINCPFGGCSGPFLNTPILVGIPMGVTAFRLLQVAEKERAIITNEREGEPVRKDQVLSMLTLVIGALVVLVILTFLVLMILGVNI